MSRNSRLTVVVPEFLDETGDFLLARLAGRGSIARRWEAADADAARLLSWQRGLLAALRLPEANHSSAATTALGAQLPEHPDWLHAEPIHLAAGLNDVALHRLTGEHALTSDERAGLSPLLSAHIESMRLALFTTTQGEWLIGAQQPLDMRSVNPRFARTHDWNVVLPAGKGAGMLRRLMTELQMLLHEHPVNEARARRGVPAANAIWLWGSGEVRASVESTPVACFGNDHFLQGVCRVQGWQAPRALHDLEGVLANRHDHDIVVVLPDLDGRRLQPIVATLDAGRTAHLELVLDEWHLSIDRWSLKKFWRRALPLDAWARA